MSTKRKRAVLSIKDKQIIISRLERKERNKFSSRIWHQQAAENELPTSPQMYDEEILATVVGDSKAKVYVAMRKMFQKMLVVDGITERY